MPLTADGIHMLRTAVLRLVEELSAPSPDGIDDEMIRQVRTLTNALTSALPQLGMRPGAVAQSMAGQGMRGPR